MKKQKVCALFCIAAISMSLATPAKADDRYPSLNETEETLYEKENQEESETKRRGHRWSRKHGFANEVM